MRKFDLIVIGSGAAGGTIAHTCRSRGWTVAIIDAHPFGGTCQLRGCDPKKALVGAAHAFDLSRKMAQIGVLDRAPQLQWADLMRFKRTFTDPVPDQHAKSYQDASIVAINGTARFTGEQSIEVNGEILSARHFAIASGAKAAPIAPGDDLLIDNEGFLNLDVLPERLLFIGGGYISFEFAHVAARVGANVQIIHGGPRPLPAFDEKLVEQLVAGTRDIGIEVHLNARVTKITREGSGVAAHAQVNGVTQTFTADVAVHGAGRVADLGDLHIEAAGIDRTKRGVKVNQYLQSTSNPHVYSAGDAADGGGLQLTPVAGDEGDIVAANLLDGNHRTADFSGLASIVYTTPALAMVGLNEDAAQKKGISFEVLRGDMSSWYSSRRVLEKRADYKVIVERDSRRILGAAIYGPHAEEQINIFALAIRSELDETAIKEALFAYPTGGSDLQYMFG